MMKRFKILKWDTNLFGYNVAQMNADNNFALEPEALRRSLIKDSIKLLYIFIELPNNLVQNNIEAAGAFKVDEKVLYHKTVKNNTVDDITPDIEPYNSCSVNDNLLSLTFQSGIYSRFYTDKNFKNNEFARLYTIWIERSVKKEIADEVLVYAVSGREYGMITLKVDKNIGIIGLFAVDGQMRGRSIGKKLIVAAEKYFSDRGIKEIEVTTQNANITACKFYESREFKVKNIKNVYHFWL
ncbi:MAG: GNAT family N-acetyltransferase [Ignavibacteria bacterium]|jgi:dTDP-4-amino-4,6-dideoxy-D-galactose acyltransferase